MEKTEKVYASQVADSFKKGIAMSKKMTALFVGHNMFVVSLAILAVIKTIKESDLNAWNKAVEFSEQADAEEANQ